MEKKDVIDNRAQYRGFLNTLLINKDAIFGMETFPLPKEIPFPAEFSGLSEKQNLGKRAESFFETAIEQSKNWRLLASNLQIVHRKKTLGEFDFFVEEVATGKKLHVELAYKFYVYDPEIPVETERWIGPNRKDTFRQKTDKLKNHQLPFLFSDEAKQNLAEKGLNTADFSQRLCFKAKLFVPKDKMKAGYPGINTDCIAGYWLHWEDFDQPEYHSHQFFAPGKTNWFGGPERHSHWKNFTGIKADIQALFAHKKSPLIYMKTQSGGFQQFFVVWWWNKVE